MFQRLLIGAICAAVFPVSAHAQHTIFVVRHAERADSSSGSLPMMAADPDLSEAGRARAASLATVLKDAHISAIFVTEFKRTQQTAAPLAKALGITPTVLSSKDMAELTARLKRTNGNALVVGHSNTVPDVVAALGVATSVTVSDTEFDQLFIVTPQSPPRVIQLRYR